MRRGGRPDRAGDSPCGWCVLAYLGLLVVLPVSTVFYRAFENGLGAAWDALSSPDALHALWLTLLVAAIAVPLNTVFGVGVSLILARHRFPGAWLLDALVDIPLAISPVVIGLALILVYGKTGWFGNWLAARGITVIFSLPGIVMASAAVSLPYVVREVLPVLQEIGTEQEQAARTLGAGPLAVFRRITLPNIRRGLAYGVTLPPPACWGSSARWPSCRAPSPARPRPSPCSSPTASTTSNPERVRGRGGAVPGRAHRPDGADGDRPWPRGLAPKATLTMRPGGEHPRGVHLEAVR